MRNRFKKISFALFLAILVVDLGPLYWSQYKTAFANDQSYSQIQTPIHDSEVYTTEHFDIPAEDSKPSLGEVKEESRLWGVDSFFSVVIPKIEASSNIIMNVDPFDEAAYKQALKQGVAQAKGSGFPGQGRQIYLFAHSTDSLINVARFNAVFYKLKDLEVGDKIVVYYADRKYEYSVSEIKIVEARDLSWLEDQQEGEYLLLQTCYPPGTSLKRLLVLAY